MSVCSSISSAVADSCEVSSAIPSAIGVSLKGGSEGRGSPKVLGVRSGGHRVCVGGFASALSLVARRWEEGRVGETPEGWGCALLGPRCVSWAFASALSLVAQHWEGGGKGSPGWPRLLPKCAPSVGPSCWSVLPRPLCAVAAIVFPHHFVLSSACWGSVPVVPDQLSVTVLSSRQFPRRIHVTLLPERQALSSCL